MIYIWLNLGAILAGTGAGLAAGLLWVRLMGPRLRVTPGLLLTALVTVWWLAAILAGALILAPDQAPRPVMVVGSPVVIWAGFVLPTVLLVERLRGLAWRAAWSDAALWLLMMLAAGLTMELIGLVPPPR